MAVDSAPAHTSRQASFQAQPNRRDHAQRFYRPELDAVRFVAFLLVFLHHTSSQFVWRSPLIQVTGLGLCLFFALSAYLITTLLLREKAQTGTVSLRDFYIRRILRIWPLYFLGLAVGLLLDWRYGFFPTDRSWYIAAALLVGNFAVYMPSFVLPLWSISLEEQFYLLWPGLTRRLSHTGLLIACLALTICSWIATGIYGHLHADTANRVWFSSLVQMQMFTAGALLALRHDRQGCLLQNRALRIVALLLTPCIWLAAIRFGGIKGGYAPGALQLIVGYAAVALTCALILDALTAAPPRIPAFLAYLGRISFGLYVFHSPVFLLGKRYLPLHRPWTLLPAELCLTIAAAALSYRFFETPFLRLKQRFEIVRSRPINA
ncbi:acyltransferase family protein [Terriglobus aquaticus]|uniref:Acyltransferase family protein n=1 Tax=Terriglobus aquaticus TaxID=940139 RepID=A0ABW9KFY5_9BACT|nr:acyltransferase [Terriglobus aquaticus]